MKQAKRKMKSNFYGKGDVRRTFTSMGDLCGQMSGVAFSECCMNKVFNIGGVTHSLREAADIVSQKYDAKLSFIDYPKRDLLIESGSTFFDATKIERVLDSNEYEDIISIL